MIHASKITTIDRHITEQEAKFPEATGEFTTLMHDLTFAARLISREVRRAGLNDILGMTGNKNVHGESVRKIDEYANATIENYMARGGNLCVMASEESEGLIEIPDMYRKGKYVLCFDPLDGSTNIDVNITIGTIFSIYRRLDPTLRTRGSRADVLQPGDEQVAAGYILYGSSTVFVYSTGNGVNIFTYEPTIGEFLLTYERIKMPYYGSYYSCNEGNYMKWSPSVRKYIDYIKTPEDDGKRPFTMRYVAAAVADIHRTLHYGGIYMYPAETNKPKGKIRLVYEANPLAFIVEQAGGMALANDKRILAIKPKDIHQTAPIIFGSRGNVKEFLEFYNEERG